ncbi:MAG: MFS transporter, partial [Candidatus Hodarchaeota archaeon]
MYLNRFINVHILPEQAQLLIQKYLFIFLLNSLIQNLASTFFILFVISKVGFAKAGVIMSIMLFFQLLIDYPSGSLGDWIGQRWVFALAYSLYGMAYYILFLSQSFTDFVIVAIFFGFANAQASGTLSSWRDNNYQKLVSKDLDPERKNFGFTLARIESLNMIILALTFIIGGIMATVISREIVFLLQSILSFFTISLILVLLQDIKIDHLDREEKKTKTEGYFYYLKGGIQFLLSSKVTFLFLIGLSIYTVTWYIWGSLLLFPIYFGYSGSDGVTGILRTIIYVNGVLIRIYVVSSLSQRFSVNKIPTLLLGHLVLFFPGLLILLHYLPPQDAFNF